MSSRRIPEPGSLIAGITFAGIGLIFLVGNVDLADRARWAWPIVLVGLGAGLLAAVLRRTTEPDAEGPVASTTSSFQPTEPSTPAPSDEPEPGAMEEPDLAGDAEVEPGLAEDGAADDDAPGRSAAEATPAGDGPRRRAGS
jgi:hypothetical protein